MLCIKTEDCELDESGPARPNGPGPDLQRCLPYPPNKGEKKAAVFGSGAEKRQGLSEGGGGTLEVPL